MNGAGRAKNKCRDFPPCFFTVFTVFARFLVFRVTSRASLAMFLPFYRSTPFSFCFNIFFYFMKNISERVKELFSHHFLKMAQLSFPKVDFCSFFAVCLFLPPHISPSGSLVVIFLARGCFRFLPTFRYSCKTPVFLAKNIIFSVKCVYFHIG